MFRLVRTDSRQLIAHNVFNGKRTGDVLALKELVEEMPRELTNRESILTICNRYIPADVAAADNKIAESA